MKVPVGRRKKMLGELIEEQEVRLKELRDELSAKEYRLAKLKLFSSVTGRYDWNMGPREQWGLAKEIEKLKEEVAWREEVLDTLRKVREREG